jgi:hypothetical protein
MRYWTYRISIVGMMFIFTGEVISNKGIRMYVTGGKQDSRYEGTSRCRELYING